MSDAASPMRLTFFLIPPQAVHEVSGDAQSGDTSVQDDDGDHRHLQALVLEMEQDIGRATNVVGIRHRACAVVEC